MAKVEWIKLYISMFENNSKINALRRLDNGDEIVLIWIMLLTLAGRCNANGAIFIREGLPYNVNGLAYDLRVDEDILTYSLMALQDNGMIEILSDLPLADMVVVNWEKYQSTERLAEIREQSKLRKRKERERKKQQSEECHATVTRQSQASHATDKEIEEEKEIEIEYKRRGNKSDLEKVLSEFVISEQLREALREFVKQRKLNKKPMTDKALKLLINKLRSLAQDEPTQIAIVNQAIEHGWLSVYPLKADARQGANGVKLSGEVDHTLDGIL